jgi:hypothetical protein
VRFPTTFFQFFISPFKALLKTFNFFLAAMGSSTMILVCMMVALAVFASRVQANYHVSEYDFSDYQKPTVESFIGCPSNYYNCACYHDGDRAGSLTQKPPVLTNFFTIENLCGYRLLNHFQNSDNTYSVYDGTVSSGTDGPVLATCYGADAGKATLLCTALLESGNGNVYDRLICYGNPCEP